MKKTPYTNSIKKKKNFHFFQIVVNGYNRRELFVTIISLIFFNFFCNSPYFQTLLINYRIVVWTIKIQIWSHRWIILQRIVSGLVLFSLHVISISYFSQIPFLLSLIELRRSNYDLCVNLWFWSAFHGTIWLNFHLGLFDRSRI
jgi:hypothetical protein